MAPEVLFVQGQHAGNINHGLNNQTVKPNRLSSCNLQINPSRRRGSGGESGNTKEVGSDEDEFLELEEDGNKEEEEEERQSLEDFVLESFEIDELPQTDYNTLGLIKPEKVSSMTHLKIKSSFCISLFIV